MEIIETPKALFETKELILMLIPIAISFVVTMFFRNKDKEEAQSIRDRDKKDNDARNLRAELREYFLTNCKPIIDEIVSNQEQKIRKLVHLRDTTSSPLDINTLQKLFKDHYSLTFDLTQKFVPLTNFANKISHKEYNTRFKKYFYIIDHLRIICNELVYPNILKEQKLYNSQESNLVQENLPVMITKLMVYIDFILAESELILFNHRFDDDEIIFQNHMDILNNCVLDTGFDPSEQFRCSREKMEQFIKPGNKTTETK